MMNLMLEKIGKLYWKPEEKYIWIWWWHYLKVVLNKIAAMCTEVQIPDIQEISKYNEHRKESICLLVGITSL